MHAVPLNYSSTLMKKMKDLVAKERGIYEVHRHLIMCFVVVEDKLENLSPPVAIDEKEDTPIRSDPTRNQPRLHMSQYY